MQVDAQPPGEVAQLKAANISDHSLDLQWSAASDDRGVAGYQLFRGDQKGFSLKGNAKQAEVSAASLRWTDQKPPAGQSAWYAVCAVDIVGRLGQPQYIEVKVPKNAPPENKLKLTAVSTGKRAFLRWSGTLERDVTMIEVLRGEGEAGKMSVIKSLTDAKIQRFVDEGLKEDTTYRYALRLVDRGKLSSKPTEPQLVRAGLFVKRINCGGDEFVGADGVPWEADKGRIAGTSIWTAKKTVAEAGELQSVYQTERWSYSKLRYQFALEPGKYIVTLHFAETNPRFAEPGKRKVDIVLNGKETYSDVDVAAKVGGHRAFQLTTEAEVTEKTLVVELRKVKNGPALKGLEVRAIP